MSDVYNFPPIFRPLTYTNFGHMMMNWGSKTGVKHNNNNKDCLTCHLCVWGFFEFRRVKRLGYGRGKTAVMIKGNQRRKEAGCEKLKSFKSLRKRPVKEINKDRLFYCVVYLSFGIFLSDSLSKCRKNKSRSGGRRNQNNNLSKSIIRNILFKVK